VGIELLLTAGLVVLMDRLTKALVGAHLARGQSLRIARWLEIRHVTVASRSLPGCTLGMLLLWGAALSLILFIMKQGDFFRAPAAQAGLGAALGGSGSNLYDRIRHGAVTDFLDLGWWPTFNVADVAITVGALVAVGFLR
jgi:signal peptidase II